MPPIGVDAAIQRALEHHQAGRLAEAEKIYRQILARFPHHADALHLLGVLAYQTGHLDAAIDLIGRAIAVNPAVAACHSNLGNALKDRGRRAEAIDAYRRAIQLRPDLVEVYSNLGSALFEQGRPDEAIDTYRRAIALKPDQAEPHSDLGNVLTDQGRLDEGIEAYRRAIQLSPGYAPAHSNLGAALAKQGRLDEAIASYRTAITVKPDFAPAASSLLFTLHFHPEHDSRSILEEHRRWASQYAEPLAAQIRAHPNDRDPDRRLNVGFLSPDFRGHPVGRLLLPLLANLDRTQTEVHCYADVKVADRRTLRLKAMADRWLETNGLSDQRLADRIRDDRIDILVDLALHTANNRLLVFARKPAPVQVTMLGLPATTGLATMDYRLTDRYLDPPGSGDSNYTERSIRLPNCFWCYQPPDVSPPVGPLPAVRNGLITFGCLNQFAKISPPALQVWITILQALPSARLLIQAPTGSAVEATRALFHNSGIARDRLRFTGRVPFSHYLHSYGDLDIGLDPFPFNGGTTTMDALWMGVPVITLEGRTAVGRGGASILSNVGLPALIARTPDEYVALAVEWAGDLARLASLRAALRERMAASPLMDGKQYAADVEAAFRRMWKRWCAS